MSLLCPRCEKPLAQHIDGECPHLKKARLSRRSFFGAMFGAAVALKAAPQVVQTPWMSFDPAAGTVQLTEVFYSFGPSAVYWGYSLIEALSGPILLTKLDLNRVPWSKS